MCEACKADPQTHSFEPLSPSSTFFYTNFKYIKDFTNVESIYGHFNTMLSSLSGQPWNWIIDCQHLSAKHLVHINTSIGILRRLTDKYSDSIRCIYLINAGPIMKTAIVAFTPFISKEFANSILKLNGSPLELYNEFKRVGLPLSDIQPLIQRIQKDYT
jgi:hypothetical protein